eukprot:1393527-Amorphochlora_amoeboformis.AAC.2
MDPKPRKRKVEFIFAVKDERGGGLGERRGLKRSRVRGETREHPQISGFCVSHNTYWAKGNVRRCSVPLDMRYEQLRELIARIFPGTMRSLAIR